MDTTYSFEKENNSLKMKLKQHEEMGGNFFFFYPVCMKNMSLLRLTQFTNEEKQAGHLPTDFSKGSRTMRYVFFCLCAILEHPILYVRKIEKLAPAKLFIYTTI